MRAIVYQHETYEGLGLLEPALVAAGFDVSTRFRAVNHREDLDAALVVVLGGSMSVRAVNHHPFLNDERAVLSERLASDQPCLGICLGAQLLASAAGAEVFPGKNGVELGIAPVRWTAAAALDPALGVSAQAKSTVAHWHEDTFSAVPQATLLASTDRYTQQAFRLGRSYGLQFHPELTADAFEAWVRRDPDVIAVYEKDAHELLSHLAKLKASEGANAELLSRLAFAFAAAR